MVIIQGVRLPTKPGSSLIILLQAHTDIILLQTHSFSFLTQRTYSCSNLVAISSLVFGIIKELPGLVGSGTSYITHTFEHNSISSSSTVGIQLHVSVLYMGHLQVVI